MIIWNGKDVIVLSIMMLLIIITALWVLYNWIVAKYRKYNSSQEFVKRNIKKILRDKPYIKIKYYCDYFDGSHYICIDTLENEETLYRDRTIQRFDRKFLLKFPDELLSFILLDDYLEFGEDGTLIFEN